MDKPKKITTPAAAASPSFWGADLRRKVTGGKTPEADAWGGQLPQVQTLASLLSKELPPKTPRIAPWLHAGESCMLWGGTGAGKSMVSTALALGCAGGGSCLNWTFPEPCKVLWIDGEQSERDIQKRFHALAATVEGIDSKKAEANLLIMARTAQTAGGAFVDIAKKEQADGIVEAVRSNDIGVVFFDNLSTLTDSIEEENSAARFKTMQALLARLKGENVACVVVHHSGKNGQSYRGSSGIATTFERILGLVKDETSDASALSVKVTVEKFRDKAPVGFQPVFPLALKEKEDGSLYWEIGDLFQLRAGWVMFQQGDYRTKKEFVAAFNARFGTTHDHRNFGTQFRQRWERKLGVSVYDINRAETMRKERAKEAKTAEEEDDGDVPAY